jgi:hypothetical protein
MWQDFDTVRSWCYQWNITLVRGTGGVQVIRLKRHEMDILRAVTLHSCEVDTNTCVLIFRVI